MAIPADISELISGTTVESTRIEFKPDFNPEPIIHTICAFANDIDNIGGGYIIIGIEEKGSIPQLPPKGIDKSRIDSILKKLEGFCHCIEPLYEPIVEPKLLDGRYIIAIWCPGGFGRPYKAAKNVYKNTSDKRYYIRKMASTVVASPQEERELFYVSSNIPFDDRPNLTASVEALSRNRIQDYLREVGSALYNRSKDMSLEALAEDLQLLAGPPEDLHPRNVGILMFSDHIEQYFKYARIEVVNLPDPTGKDMTEKVFKGPIQTQLSDALLFIKNYIIASKTNKLPNKAEALTVWNYPYAAVEEILSNAVYHRSYQISEPIVVRITPKSMEITSYPGFDRSITDADIAARHIQSRIYRNRRIGDFLKELHLIEGRNTGFPTAFKALRENGSALPAFHMDPDRSYLSVEIPVHPAFAPRDAKKRHSIELEKRVLDALGNEPLLISELSRKIGYKRLTAKLRTVVDTMAEDGRIVPIHDGGRIRYKKTQGGSQKDV